MPKLLSDNDATRMIAHSVVEYEGRLVMGGREVYDSQVDFTDLETTERITVLADFDKIKNPVSGLLGYLNQPEGTSFFRRTAARITRMGLGYDNLIAAASHSARDANAASRFGVHLFMPIVKAYRNEYPSFEEAYENAIDHGIPTAFDRSFAIHRDGRLYFQGTQIGRANPRGEAFCELSEPGKLLQFVRNIPKLKWRN